MRAPNAELAFRPIRGSADERAFEFFGCAFRVATRSAAALALLDRLYGRYAATPSRAGQDFALDEPVQPAGRAWRLSTEDGASRVFDSLRSALQELEYQVCQRVIDGAVGFVVLHGATVCGPMGSVFIAGRSEAGKTTLALALAARGHAVMSDDIALLEPLSGAIYPVPRCFHLDERSRRLLRRAGLRLPALARHYGFVSPADVNCPRSGAAAVRHIVLLESTRGPAPLLTSLPQAAAVATLSEEAGWGDVPAAFAISSLARLTAGASCWKLRSGRLQRTAAAVEQLIA